MKPACSLIVGSRHGSYVYEKLLPPITILLRYELRSFYFSEFHDCSLAYFGKDLYALTKSTQHLSQSFGFLLYWLIVLTAPLPYSPRIVVAVLMVVLLLHEVGSSQLALEFSIRTARSNN